MIYVLFLFFSSSSSSSNAFHRDFYFIPLQHLNYGFDEERWRKKFKKNEKKNLSTLWRTRSEWTVKHFFFFFFFFIRLILHIAQDKSDGFYPVCPVSIHFVVVVDFIHFHSGKQIIESFCSSGGQWISVRFVEIGSQIWLFSRSSVQKRLTK